MLEKNEWPSAATKDYVTNVRCPDTVFIPMIESLAGIENLDAICSIPGVHAVFVGPNDLTTTMGIPNEYDHKDLIAMLEEDHRHRRPAPRRSGLLVRQNRTDAADDSPGRRLVVYSNDSAMMREAMMASFGELRKG